MLVGECPTMCRVVNEIGNSTGEQSSRTNSASKIGPVTTNTPPRWRDLEIEVVDMDGSRIDKLLFTRRDGQLSHLAGLATFRGWALDGICAALVTRRGVR